MDILKQVEMAGPDIRELFEGGYEDFLREQIRVLQNENEQLLKNSVLLTLHLEQDLGILPCPVCGSHASMNCSGLEFFVACDDPGCNCGGPNGTLWDSIAVWNRRSGLEWNDRKLAE